MKARPSNKQSNPFSKWVGESNTNYSGKEMGQAFLICLGLIALSLVLTSGARLYNYDHFIHSQGNFLPDGFSLQLTLFLIYGVISLLVVACSAISSQKGNKKLMLGASLAAMGISAIAVLALLFGLDFLTIVFYVHQAGLGISAFSRMLDAYFLQYGILYLIPAALALLSFGVKGYYQNRQQETSGEQGTAAFANRNDLREMGAYAKSDDEGAIFGKDDKNQLLRYPLCNRTIVSQTGGGKTSSIIIPALLTQKSAMFINDIKGELWAVTALYRFLNFGHQIVAIDPQGVTRTPEFLAGKPAYFPNKVYRYNPLDAISRDADKRDGAIGALVKSLMSRNGQYGKDNHFEDMSEVLLCGLIEWVIMQNEKPTLMMVHDILSDSKEELENTLTEMRDSDFLRAKAAGAQVLAAAHEERGSILTTTYRQLSWLADPNLRDLVSETNFNLQDFISGKMDIYVIMPGTQSREHSRVFRMLLASVRNLMLQTPISKISKDKLLFLFDELGQLGYCQDIEEMIPIMRAYNGVFWSVFQDIGQIKKYGDMKSLFTGAKMLQFFGISDNETIKWICELGGRKTYLNTGSSESKGKSGGRGESRNESVSSQESGTELLKYNEVREMPFDKQLVFIEGAHPILCNKVFYFKEECFRGKYDRNPYEDK